MFKKTLLVTSITLATLSGSVHAIPDSSPNVTRIVGCGTNSATLEFQVLDSGWYLVSTSSDSDADGWRFVVPFLKQTIQIKDTHSKSFAVITDHETGTTVVAKCTN